MASYKQLAATIGLLALGVSAQASMPGYASSIAFTGVGIVRSNHVGCYYDEVQQQEICLTPAYFNLPAPGQKVTITATYAPVDNPIQLSGDYVAYPAGDELRFSATPTDGSASFEYTGDTFGEIRFRNGRIAGISAAAIGGDACGFYGDIDYDRSLASWPGRFSSNYCASIASVFPFYGVAGDWRMTAYSIDGGAFIAIPEPASWALMASGFGLAGAMLRRRRTVAAG